MPDLSGYRLGAPVMWGGSVVLCKYTATATESMQDHHRAPLFVTGFIRILCNQKDKLYPVSEDGP